MLFSVLPLTPQSPLHPPFASGTRFCSFHLWSDLAASASSTSGLSFELVQALWVAIPLVCFEVLRASNLSAAHCSGSGSLFLHCMGLLIVVVCSGFFSVVVCSGSLFLTSSAAHLFHCCRYVPSAAHCPTTAHVLWFTVLFALSDGSAAHLQVIYTLHACNVSEFGSLLITSLRLGFSPINDTGSYRLLKL
ncbi:hypothetical protein Fmac_029065 [Flemingia macrophylla]|uniref:Uncharacterized protein n=1 Tax=Flemingia macrophylla TaxID=520843 RepID=A0ABD1L997_9FABA